VQDERRQRVEIVKWPSGSWSGNEGYISSS
jgi:hypothetical protein